MRGEDDLKRELEKIGTAYAESFNKQDGAGISGLYANGLASGQGRGRFTRAAAAADWDLFCRSGRAQRDCRCRSV